MPVSSQLPHLDIPVIDVFSFLRNRHGRNFPDHKTIYMDGDTKQSYTWREVFSQAISFGKSLIADFGIQKGDVVAIISPNCIEYAPAVLGCLWAGAIVSPANPNYTATEIERQLRDCAAKVVLAQSSSTVFEACRITGIRDDCIVLLGDRDHTTTIKRKIKTWKWALSRPESTHDNSTRTKRRLSPKTDVAFLVYSSGTTGLPKGVMLSHYNIVASTLQIHSGEEGNLTWDGSQTAPGIPLAPPHQGDVILACLPFFHVYGLTHLLLQPLYSGCSTVVMQKFEIGIWCRLVEDHKITYTYIVPPIALLLAKHAVVSRYDLWTIRMANSGAAPLSTDLIESVFCRTGIRIKQSYGLSEASPCAFAQGWADWKATKGSAGRLLTNMEAKFTAVPGNGTTSSTDHDTISSTHSTEVASNEVGELCIRGPNIFLGYHRQPEETAACLDADGWLKTGDVGYLDQGGNLFITDRIKELIKYKGFQVAPAELEALLREHPLVGDVAVVGVESQEFGTEVPRAYVARAGSSASGGGVVREADEKAAIKDWLSSRVVSYKRLRGGVCFVPSIPRSATGKILRRVLKEQARKDFQIREIRPSRI